jgi:twitching motility protein PilT
LITVEQLLMTAREEGASDVHITVGVPPRMRVNGRIANLDYPSLSETDCSKIIYSIMDVILYINIGNCIGISF